MNAETPLDGEGYTPDTWFVPTSLPLQKVDQKDKFRWTITVVTRYSGSLVVYCKDKAQAEENVQKFKNSMTVYSAKSIEFNGLSNLPNVFRTDEIVSVTMHDGNITDELNFRDIVDSAKLRKAANLYIDTEDEE